MTDRDRLILDITKSDKLHNEKCKKCTDPNGSSSYCANCACEQLADNLIADGWIRPPCKVGDTVYIPFLNTILHTKVFAFGIDEDGNKVINPKEYPEGVFGVVGCEIGKTVFPTKEEAEKALEGMNNA